jgi:hypothetical protein
LVTGASFSESLLLELLTFLTVDGVKLVFVATGATLDCFLLSSEESESDDESFFLFLDAVTGVDTASFLAAGVTGATIHTNDSSCAL